MCDDWQPEENLVKWGTADSQWSGVAVSYPMKKGKRRKTSTTYPTTRTIIVKSNNQYWLQCVWIYSKWGCWVCGGEKVEGSNNYLQSERLSFSGKWMTVLNLLGRNSLGKIDFHQTSQLMFSKKTEQTGVKAWAESLPSWMVIWNLSLLWFQVISLWSLKKYCVSLKTSPSHETIGGFLKALK